MQLIKLKFLKDGVPFGREYTYYSIEDVEVNDTVTITDNTLGVVMATHVPDEEIESFRDRVKTIDGLYDESEIIPPEDITVEETEIENLDIVAKYEDGKITTNFEALKITLAEKVAEYKKLVVTEANKAKRKKDIASLRRIDKDITSKVSTLKAEYLKEFESVPKAASELKELTAEAITAILDQVQELEDAQREIKMQDIRTEFDEIFVDYPTLKEEIGLVNIYDSRWENISFTIKSVRQEITEKLDKIRDDVKNLSSMVSDKTAEALKLFWGDLDYNKAVSMINQYEKQKLEISAQLEERHKREQQQAVDAEMERVKKEERLKYEAEQKVERDKQEAILKAEREKNELLQRVAQEKAEAEENARREVIAIQEAKEKAELEAMTVKRQTEETESRMYFIKATDEEFEQVEMYLNSLGISFER